MRAADLEVGQEYEITAQANPARRGWPRKFNPGRVKLLAVDSGRCRCEYLKNPYSGWAYYDGSGEIEVSTRSLLRSWEEVVAEKEEQRDWQVFSAKTEAEAERDSQQLLQEMSWLQGELREASPVYDLNDNPIEVEVTLTVPLSVLRGIKRSAEEHGEPQPVKEQEADSVLSDLI